MSSDVYKEANKFVNSIIGKYESDKGLIAALKRADNPATEYQSWEFLVKSNVELNNKKKRLPYATIAASVARAKPGANGSIGIGRAIASCYEDGSNNDQAKAKMRRLLACNTVEETCLILRPLLSLIESKAIVTLDYAKVLSQLLFFESNAEITKSIWAQDFYGYVAEGKEEEK